MAKNKLTIKQVIDENIKTTAKLNEVNWDFARMFPGGFKSFSVFGDQISFGEDYVSVEEARVGFEWVVEQLGGKVTWKR